MRRLLVVLTLAFVLMTLAAGAYDLWGPDARSGFFHTGGEVWFELSRNTLNLMQAVVQRYLSPSLWDPAIVSVLKLPLVAVLGLIGAALAAVSWLLRARD
ncbi:MAG: hypothetical protein COA62_07630 [Rhodobiaceae bacterium]|nr:MAG: hypothetical protein COA62_07630 [Rhodobiaceae bacterium]